VAEGEVGERAGGRRCGRRRGESGEGRWVAGLSGATSENGRGHLRGAGRPGAQRGGGGERAGRFGARPERRAEGRFTAAGGREKSGLSEGRELRSGGREEVADRRETRRGRGRRWQMGEGTWGRGESLQGGRVPVRLAGAADAIGRAIARPRLGPRAGLAGPGPGVTRRRKTGVREGAGTWGDRIVESGQARDGGHGLGATRRGAAGAEALGARAEKVGGRAGERRAIGRCGSGHSQRQEGGAPSRWESGARGGEGVDGEWPRKAGEDKGDM
jgi:hypothetical protein